MVARQWQTNICIPAVMLNLREAAKLMQLHFVLSTYWISYQCSAIMNARTLQLPAVRGNSVDSCAVCSPTVYRSYISPHLLSLLAAGTINIHHPKLFNFVHPLDKSNLLAGSWSIASSILLLPLGRFRSPALVWFMWHRWKTLKQFQNFRATHTLHQILLTRFAVPLDILCKVAIPVTVPR